MDGKYYVFKNDEYAPPSTLGELFDLVDLPNVIELSRFSENGDGPNKKHYALNSDNYVWEALSGCKNAEFVEDEKWTVYEREYLTREAKQIKVNCLCLPVASRACFMAISLW